MKYNVTYKQDNVYQSIFVEAPAATVAADYFCIQKPFAEVLDVRKSCPDDEKPGKPVMVVPEARWKGAGFGDYRCSLCDEEVSGTLPFCPHCHAYMG